MDVAREATSIRSHVGHGPRTHQSTISHRSGRSARGVCNLLDMQNRVQRIRRRLERMVPCVRRGQPVDPTPDVHGKTATPMSRRSVIYSV